MTTTTTSKVIEGRLVTVAVGSMIELTPTRVELLLACDDWDGAEYRFPSRHSPCGIACNVEITGRTFQFRWSEGTYVKVRVEWVDEDQPSRFSEGWMKVNPWSCEQVEEAA